MSDACCADWARRAPDKIALTDLSDGQRQDWTYQALEAEAQSLAADLSARGVAQGDRVGVFRSQGAWTLIAHLAIWKCGAISLPLFTAFRKDALLARVNDAEPKLILTDPKRAPIAQDCADDMPAVEDILVLEEMVFDASEFDAVNTKEDDPAILLYTSGTTGNPKGALLPHRVLLGHLPGVEISHNFLGMDQDRIWTPADWAWIGGLLDVMAPALALGVPLVASNVEKFDPMDAKTLIEGEGIRNVFFPPTALKMLRASGVTIDGLRTVASGGEPLGSELLDWACTALGVTINEFYGQTECNMIVSSCGDLFPNREGAIGRIVPGHDVAVIDMDGNPTDEEGDISIKTSTPVMMLGYWRNPEATAQKFRGDWMLTGDRGILEDGYICFIGREDDVISSAGYRIGPAPIENALLKHKAVQFCGVVGLPDEQRHEAVSAFVVLNEGFDGSNELSSTLTQHVKSNLSAHEAPRQIHFVDALPMTVTGKVMRKKLKEMAPCPS